MKTVYQNPLYSFIRDEAQNILIFEWTEATASMTDDDFMEALHNYAGFAFEYRGPGLLVDVRNFRHKISEEAGKWRNEICLPRYLSAGSTRMGYLVPEKVLENLPQGDVVLGQFKDRYFSSRKEANAWLKQKS